MKADYTYEHKIVIDRVRNNVVTDFFDYDNYHKWQPTLSSVQRLKGSDTEKDHQFQLIYSSSSNREMIMNETILDISLPHKAIIQYTMGTTRNIQYNYFESFGDKTMWTCTTEFYFDSKPPATLDIFKQSTKQSLVLFKQYVEQR